MPALAKSRILSVVIPPLLQRCSQRLDSLKVLVVAKVFLRQQRVKGVMEVVTPLSIETVTTNVGIAHDARIIQITLGN